MRLPFVAEPLSMLRSRYPAALETLHDHESISPGVAAEPSKFRACVFDCPDGMRLIVSRECFMDGKKELHVSASFEVGSAIDKSLDRYRQRRKKMLRAFRRMAERRFHELSGDDRPLMFIGWTVRYIPHWHIEE